MVVYIFTIKRIVDMSFNQVSTPFFEVFPLISIPNVSSLWCVDQIRVACLPGTPPPNLILSPFSNSFSRNCLSSLTTKLPPSSRRGHPIKLNHGGVIGFCGGPRQGVPVPTAGFHLKDPPDSLRHNSPSPEYDKQDSLHSLSWLP